MPTFKRICAALGLAVPLAAAAMQPVVQQQAGISFVSGGIGAEEQANLQAVRKDFNLRILFANKRSGEYRADVNVVVATVKGDAVLTLDGAGPYLYIKLAPGAYTISAKAGSQSQVQKVMLGTNQTRELGFYWNAE